MPMRISVLAVVFLVVASTSSNSFAQSRAVGWKPTKPIPSTAGATPPVQKRATKKRAMPAATRIGATAPLPAPENVPTPSPVPTYTEEMPSDGPMYEPQAGFSPCDCASGEDYWDEGCCDAGPRVWARAEYLLWWTKGMDVPALATTSPEDTPQDEAGVLGEPGTRILFGNGGLNDHAQSGGRFSMGAWLDDSHVEGIEVNYLTLGQQSDHFSGSSDEFDILARPFFDVQTGTQAASPIAYPDVISGDMNIAATTSFQTLEILFRYVAKRTCCTRTDFFVGYRYGDLRDHLRVGSFTTALSGDLEGDTFEVFDQFNTRNTFNGLDLGMTYQWEMRPCWTWELSAKVALGTTVSHIGINGATTITVPDEAPVTTVGGLLTQGTNIGNYERSEFGSIGEFGLTSRRSFSCGLTAVVGYRFLYWADVARAGKQIDTRINPTQVGGEALVGAALPAFLNRTETFWAQGFHFGLEYAF